MVELDRDLVPLVESRTHTLPHLTGAEARILELLDQRRRLTGG